jgi:hypothetical protein
MCAGRLRGGADHHQGWYPQGGAAAEAGLERHSDSSRVPASSWQGAGYGIRLESYGKSWDVVG